MAQLAGIFTRTNGDSRLQSRIKDFFTSDVTNYLKQVTTIYQGSVQGKLSLAEAQQAIDRTTDEILNKGNEIDETISDKRASKALKRVFRSQVYDWVYQSRIGQRTIQRPRGYPGDYKTIDIFYDNKPLSDGMGTYFDRHILTRPYAAAVRNRLRMMQTMLRDYISASSQDTVRILDIACGPCREIEELFSSWQPPRKQLHFIFLDQDSEALDYSKEKLVNLPSNIKTDFIAEDVANIIKDPEAFSKKLGKQHFIYSICLADYLPDRVLKKLMHFCYALLDEGGQLVVTHKDRTSHKPITPDWLCDWTFIPRDENQLLEILKLDTLIGASYSVERDESGIILFCVINKQKS